MDGDDAAASGRPSRTDPSAQALALHNLVDSCSVKPVGGTAINRLTTQAHLLGRLFPVTENDEAANFRICSLSRVLSALLEELVKYSAGRAHSI
eukprot:3005167-Pleurochrysis_carterae.AAC.2